MSARQGIDRREFLATTGAATAALAAGGFPVHSGSRGRPNLLFVMTDQQYLDTISAGGCEHVATPAMDRLMRTGVSFRQSYSASPVCCPARGSLMTGRTPTETGVYANGKSVREGIPNLGQWFSAHSDYRTVYVGKWHLRKTYTYDVPGFEVLHTGIGGQGNLCDTSIAQAAAARLRRRDGSKPFLMVVSFMQPHDICEWLRLNRDEVELRFPEVADQLPPLPGNFEFDFAEPSFVKSKRRDREPHVGQWSELHWRYYLWSYYRHIEQVDAEVGRLLQAVDEAGLGEDTLVVFTSDHGEGLARHQLVRKSAPYEETTNVPLIFSWPGQFSADRVVDSMPVSGLDLVPTLCELAGIEAPPDMRGRSLVPALAGTEDPDRSIVVDIPGNRGRVVRDSRFKLISYVEDPVELLFDMDRDPLELRDLSASPAHADVIARLKARARAWEEPLVVAPDVPNGDAWWRSS